MSQACPERHGDIGAYIIGALDLVTRADVQQHLADCSACRTEYLDLLPVRRWLSRLPRKAIVSGGRGSTVQTWIPPVS
jgi:hypothetical protein